MQAPPPEHCPGVESEEAGKGNACAGCPNQSICSDPNKKLEDPGKALVAESLKDVRNKLLILSGKGGVGKSTVTTLLTATWPGAVRTATLASWTSTFAVHRSLV